MKNIFGVLCRFKNETLITGYENMGSKESVQRGNLLKNNKNTLTRENLLVGILGLSATTNLAE